MSAKSSDARLVRPQPKLSNRMKQYQIRSMIVARRRARVRAKVSGTAVAPRLSVKRSLAHISAQIIDDTVGKTLVSAHDREIKTKGTKTERALELGKLIAEKAKGKGISRAVFDKGAAKYHGRVKAVADGARENGLVI